MSFKDWLVQLLASRWVMPDPRVAEATLQQRNVTGDTHSRKVDARAFEWQAAEACAERGLYGAAAEWAIRASSEHGTCRVVNPQEAQ